MAAKKGTNVGQEGVSDHYNSAKAAIRWSAKVPLLPTSVYITSTVKEEKSEPQARKPTGVKEGSSLHQ